MDYTGVLLVVKSEDEEHEVELDLENVPVAGRAITLGQAVEKMLEASGDGEVVVTVHRFFK